MEAEADHDDVAARHTLPRAVRDALRTMDDDALDQAIAEGRAEDLFERIYMRAVCRKAIEEKSPLVELYPYSKGSMGTYRDAYVLLEELRRGKAVGLAPGVSVRIAG